MRHEYATETRDSRADGPVDARGRLRIRRFLNRFGDKALVELSDGSQPYVNLRAFKLTDFDTNEMVLPELRALYSAMREVRASR